MRTSSWTPFFEQALHDRQAGQPQAASFIIALICGSPICLRSRTPSGSPEAGIEPSVGSVGDCYDNALAETINRPLQG